MTPRGPLCYAQLVSFGRPIEDASAGPLCHFRFPYPCARTGYARRIGRAVASATCSRSLLYVVSDSDRAFLIAIDPPLVSGDLPAVMARLRANWPPGRLAELTASPLEAVARLAATCLGLTGSMEHCERLAALLGHADEQVAAAAENALWSIWMQAGSAEAHRQLSTAIQCLQQAELERALGLLGELIAAEPALAEAYHQRALALQSLERYDEAEAAYQAALERNPYHFAATAGLGHIRAERGDYSGALDFYKRALKIHPRLAGIREIVPQLEAALDKRDVA